MMLCDFSRDFQNIAEAISAVLELDVEIVDKDLNVVAGTGIYKERVGSKEAEGYLYTTVLKTKRHFIIKNPSENPRYDPSSVEGRTPETIEMCCPILAQGEVLGVVGLVGFDLGAKERVLKDKDKYLSFLRYMADLIASKMERDRIVSEVYQLKNRLQTIIDLFQDGVISTNSEGIINFVNKAGAEVLGQSKDKLINRRIEEILPDSAIAYCLEDGKDFVHREEIHRFKDCDLHLLSSTKAIKAESSIIGAVSVFKKIADIKKMFYDISGRQKACRFEDIVGESPCLASIKALGKKIAQNDTTVLILGESGTGKELFARSIHEASPRSQGPFVAINCAGIPTSLLESELFGYEGGAFTGARKNGKVGKFEMADRGTVFLDEIGDMSLDLQVKLLRVIQERTIERLGGVAAIPIDVRIIAATNRNLEEMVEKGEFRDDLYYRLNVIQLKIPPLRERKQDIPLLMDYFLQYFNQRLKKNIEGFSPEAYNIMMAYDWPGNVRELENAIAHAINMETDTIIQRESLPAKMIESSGTPAGMTLKARLKEYEKTLISKALAQQAGPSLLEVRKRTAAELDIGIATLYRKIKEYGLDEQASSQE